MRRRILADQSGAALARRWRSRAVAAATASSPPPTGHVRSWSLPYPSDNGQRRSRLGDQAGTLGRSLGASSQTCDDAARHEGWRYSRWWRPSSGFKVGESRPFRRRTGCESGSCRSCGSPAPGPHPNLLGWRFFAWFFTLSQAIVNPQVHVDLWVPVPPQWGGTR